MLDKVEEAMESERTDTVKFSALTRKTLVLVLAGGEGSRLYELTEWRAKPSVPFGGRFRIIDFTLSNCVNSGLRRIGVLTQYRAHSLIRHLQRAWGFLRTEVGEFIEILPAQQRTMEKEWYKGTVDAVFQNIDIIHHHHPGYVLILGGDHIYTMDYSRMLMQHINKDADITVGCIEVPRKQAGMYGVMSIDEASRIMHFAEKPDEADPIPGKTDTSLASMGIYIFSTDILYRILHSDAEDAASTHDFGRDILPAWLNKCRTFAYRFQNKDGSPAYWRDVGTVDSFWQANLELCDIEPELNLYNFNWPICTYQTQLPPAKFIFDDAERCGCATDSLISSGCVISGARVKRSVISSATRIESFSRVERSVVLPMVTIGRNCRIIDTILDKGCVVPDGTVIGEDRDEDGKHYHVTPSGIRLVTPAMLGQDRDSTEERLVD